jgi:hypothetical protein
MKGKDMKKKTIKKTTCNHPPARVFSWYVNDPLTGKKVLCTCCCDCGAVLSGGAK